MYLIFEYPFDPANGSIIVDPETGTNMIFESIDDARIFADENCAHEFIVICLA